MKKILAIVLAGILCVTFPFVFGGKEEISAGSITSERAVGETAVIVSKENAFYPLIATPVALYYDSGQHVAPNTKGKVTHKIPARTMASISFIIFSTCIYMTNLPIIISMSEKYKYWIGLGIP